MEQFLFWLGIFVGGWLMISLIFWLSLVYEQFVLKRIDHKFGGPISPTWKYSILFSLVIPAFYIMWIVMGINECCRKLVHTKS